jgi:hypothetical protein
MPLYFMTFLATLAASLLLYLGAEDDGFESKSCSMSGSCHD